MIIDPNWRETQIYKLACNGCGKVRSQSAYLDALYNHWDTMWKLQEAKGWITFGEKYGLLCPLCATVTKER